MRTLASGLALGLGAGVAPGPLLGLVVTTSLARGARAGCEVAVAPLLTDVPIVLAAVAFMTAVPAPAVACLALVGAGVVGSLAVETLRAVPGARLPGPDPGVEVARAAADACAWQRPWVRGSIVNLSSPHPWLFWATVGGPLLVVSWQQSPQAAAGWLMCFYAMLVGVKVAIAVGVGAGRSRMTQRAYRAALATVGVLMVVVAAALAAQAVRALVA